MTQSTSIIFTCDNLYSPNKVAMYMKEQINNQKEVQAEKIQ